MHTRTALRAAVALRGRAQRDAQQQFLVEGLRELRAALQAGWSVEVLFYCEALYSSELNELLEGLKCPQYRISTRDFSRLAYREESGGFVAVVKMKSLSLSSLKIGSSPLLLILDNIEKPGNLGAILRTAAAAAVDGLLLCGNTDPYNPNVVRNSLGALFLVPWLQTTPEEAQDWARKHNIQLLGLDPEGDTIYTEATLRRATAVVIGAEAYGLRSEWQKSCAKLLRLPLHNSSIDSLNVASCAAIVTYEALRQRNTKAS